jgi:hypothetical protein
VIVDATGGWGSEPDVGELLLPVVAVAERRAAFVAPFVMTSPAFSNDSANPLAMSLFIMDCHMMIATVEAVE